MTYSNSSEYAETKALFSNVHAKNSRRTYDSGKYKPMFGMEPTRLISLGTDIEYQASDLSAQALQKKTKLELYNRVSVETD